VANPPSEHTASSTGLDRLEHPTVAGAGRVGWGFISLYTLAFISTSLLFLAPLLVTLALKVNSLVGIEQAPNSLAVVTGIAALLAMVANPFFGRMSDRTTSPLGMRRPWMVIGLVGGSLGILMVALAPNIPVVLVGWCIAQLLFNALLAALVAVLPDQVPAAQRGLVSGVLGVCVPIASVSGTFPGHGVEDAVGERVRRRGDVRRLGQRLVRGLDRLLVGRVGDLALGEGEDDRAAAVLLWWEAAGQADNLPPDPDQRTR
jgi:MFS family permease